MWTVMSTTPSDLLPVVSASMTHVGAAHPENHVFGDIGGVVCDALQIARDEQYVERRTRHRGFVVHFLDQHNKGFILHAIHNAIHLENGLGHLGFAVEESLEP